MKCFFFFVGVMNEIIERGTRLLVSRNRDCRFGDKERIHQVERETKRHFCLQERGNNPVMDTEERGLSSR